jgi:hypothetical protein
METTASATLAPTRMTKRQLRKEARAMILSGHNRQQTFEELQTKAKNPQEEIATIVRFVPSLEARQKYKWAQSTLIILLVLSVFFKLMAALPDLIEASIGAFVALLFLPLINVVMLIGVVSHWGGTYRFVAYLALIGVTRLISKPIDDMAILLAELFFAGTLASLGLLLHHKLVPDYVTIKEKYTNAQGQPRLRNRIVFDADRKGNSAN